jgi:hypothetical protein
MKESIRIGIGYSGIMLCLTSVVFGTFLQEWGFDKLTSIIIALSIIGIGAFITWYFTMRDKAWKTITNNEATD